MRPAIQPYAPPSSGLALRFGGVLAIVIATGVIVWGAQIHMGWGLLSVVPSLTWLSYLSIADAQKHSDYRRSYIDGLAHLSTADLLRMAASNAVDPRTSRVLSEYLVHERLANLDADTLEILAA